MLELFFLPMQLFFLLPWLAFVPAGLFGWWWWRGRGAPGRWLLLVASAAWLGYGVYEWRMSAWSKTVVAPIRVDLLLVTPVVYFATALGVLGMVLARRKAGSSSD